MKNLTLYYSAGLLLSALIFSSCSKEEKLEPTIQKDKQNDAVLQHILNIGFKKTDVQENKTEYIVQGDIIFPKNMIIPKSKNGRISQYYIGTLLNIPNQSDVKVMVDNSMTDMLDEINSAMSQWNNTNSQIYFRRVYSGSYDILIKDENLGYGVCGQAVFPSNGAAGNLVRINKSEISGNSFAQRQRTITHEFGHTIGFTHTNVPSDGTSVPGVGGTDANSLMNAGQCGSGATQLSTNDILATNALYPTVTPRSISYNGDYDYPRTVNWQAPKYTAAGPVIGYDFYYVAYTYQAGTITSPVYSTTGMSYTFPFTLGQYNGASLVTFVRAKYSNGYISDWNSYNTMLR